MYRCTACGERIEEVTPQCPACGLRGLILADTGEDEEEDPTPAAVPLGTIRVPTVTRLPTGLRALDRVLGGGVALGSTVLLGGAEGAGKSTLALQACAGLSTVATVVYIAAEQSAEEVRAYAERLQLELRPTLRLVREPTVAEIERALRQTPARVIAVDSLNTISEDEGEPPGTPRQVLACTARLVALAKAGRAVLLIAHLNNENRVAGSRRLRYLVDVVLGFEIEAGGSSGRRLWSSKNRFGPCDVARLEMTAMGLR